MDTARLTGPLPPGAAGLPGIAGSEAGSAAGLAVLAGPHAGLLGLGHGLEVHAGAGLLDLLHPLAAGPVVQLRVLAADDDLGLGFGLGGAFGRVGHPGPQGAGHQAGQDDERELPHRAPPGMGIQRLSFGLEAPLRQANPGPAVGSC